MSTSHLGGTQLHSNIVNTKSRTENLTPNCLTATPSNFSLTPSTQTAHLDSRPIYTFLCFYKITPGPSEIYRRRSGGGSPPPNQSALQSNIKFTSLHYRPPKRSRRATKQRTTSFRSARTLIPIFHPRNRLNIFQFAMHQYGNPIDIKFVAALTHSTPWNMLLHSVRPSSRHDYCPQPENHPRRAALFLNSFHSITRS